MPKSYHQIIEQEAKAFDRQIDERIANGFVPDISFSKPCDWFYNNSWRRPEYVKLDIGEKFNIVRDAIEFFTEKKPSLTKILEVGCGPGHLCLELARSGFRVTGIDVSRRCIEIAKDYAESDPQLTKRDKNGSCLTYLAGDFMYDDRLLSESFDVVIFLGSLHHFTTPYNVLSRVTKLLRNLGIVIVDEPTRDRMSVGNAVFIHMVRVLLSIHKGFYKDCKIPHSSKMLYEEILKLFNDMKYETPVGGKTQSVNDNESGFNEMYPALTNYFKEVLFEWRYAFFHELIGGLRFDENKNAELAKYLRDIDKELCRQGVLQATEFFYVGRKFLPNDTD